MKTAEFIGNWLAHQLLRWRIRRRKALYGRSESSPYYIADYRRWEYVVFGNNLDPDKYSPS